MKLWKLVYVFIRPDLWVTEKVFFIAFLSSVQSSATSKKQILFLWEHFSSSHSFSRKSISRGSKKKKKNLKIVEKLRKWKTQFCQTVATVVKKPHKTRLNYNVEWVCFYLVNLYSYQWNFETERSISIHFNFL